MKFVPRTLAVVLMTLAWSQVSLADVVSPEVVSPGKEHVLHLNAKDVTSVRLLPGGPHLVESIAINPKENATSQQDVWQLLFQHEGARKVLRRNGVAWAIEAGNHLVANLENQKIASYTASAPLLDIAATGTLLALANDNNGVTVLDIKQPDKPLWQGSHQKLGRVIRVVPAGDKQVLALNDADVVYLLDLKNPLEPTVVNIWRSRHHVQDLAWSKQQVYLRGETQVDVVDFSDAMPQISNQGLNFGQGVNYGGQRRVDIVGNIAYVADWFSGIHLYDISNPRTPLLLSSFHTPGSPKGMLVHNQIAYVPDDDHGLQIIDVRNPLEPKQIAHLPTNGLGYTPKLLNGILYLASHRGGFQIIDVSNPANPVQLSEIDTPGKAWSLAVHAKKLYVADDDNGLLIYDVSDNAQPKQIGQFKPGTAAEEVVIRDNIAFVAFFDDGLYVLDVSDPAQPKVLSHTSLPGNSRGLELVGNKLYVASWLAGVHILNVSDLTNPLVIGSYDTRGATWGLKVQGDYLYTMDWWGGLAVLNVSKAESPYLIGDYNHRGFVHDIQLADKYAFVAQGGNGLQIFEVSNPVNPTWVTGLNFNGDAQKIVLHDKRAYLALGDGGLSIADISDPFKPVWLSNVSSDGRVVDVRVVGQYAVVQDEKQGILWYDISQVQQPTVVARLNVTATALAADQEHVWVATAQTLSRYLVDKKQQPRRQAAQTLKLPIQKMLLQGNTLYAAQANSLQLFDSKTLKPGKKIDLDANITALTAHEHGLLVATTYEIVQLDNNLQITQRYPQISPVTSLVSNAGAIFMGGAKTINAQRLLPELRMDKNSFTLPGTTAIGSYDLLLSYSNKKQERFNNAFRVEMPKFSKPTLSMEEFKALLEQQKADTAAEKKQAEQKLLAPKVEEARPVEQKPVEQKPVEQKPVEQKPVEQKPVEQKPVEQKPVEQKPEAASPVEQKTAGQ